jgi:hypothetical protein
MAFSPNRPKKTSFLAFSYGTGYYAHVWKCSIPPRMELRLYYILSNEGGRFSLAR